MLGVTVRTLSNWERAALRPAARRPGRPGHSRSAWHSALRQVVRAWRRLGRRSGWRAVWRFLGCSVPRRLVQGCLAALKARRRRRERRRRAAHRQSVRVLLRDVIWCQDAAHLGRCAGRGVLGEVVKDRASLLLPGLGVGPAATGREVVSLLEGVAVRRGLPLVLGTDNGSQYCNEVVAGYLRAERVVHLRNLPRTPEHNGAAERAVGELKGVSGLGRGVRLAGVGEAQQRLHDAQRVLNEELPRASLGWATAASFDRSLRRGEDTISRKRFYEVACRAMKHAVQNNSSARARRIAEREAIYATLQSFGLITRTRGGVPLPVAEQERVS